MNLAVAATFRSEDPYVKVGACALRWDYSVAGVGYNGPPSGVEVDWSDRDKRLARVIHAERNALGYARIGEIKLIACTMLPCPDCLTEIAKYRIPLVVYDEIYKRNPLSLELAKEFKIKLIQVNSPELESIILQKTC